jgi:sugar lactone lactonase YvrE
MRRPTEHDGSRTAHVVAEGFSLLEGPRWSHDALYVSDFFSRRVLRFPSPVDGRYETVCEVSGQPSGLAIAESGTVYAVSMLDRTLVRWNGSSIEVVADLSRVPGPANDIAMDHEGRCYVGNFGLRGGVGTELEPTELLMVQPDGSVSVAADDVVFPNGMVLTADGQTLLVAETYRGRITAFDVVDGGGLGARRVWADFAVTEPPLEIKAATDVLPVLPDGLCLDVEGALWVADAKGHGVSRVEEGGRVLDFVETGSLSVYAPALGGPDRTTLFLCCAPPVETFEPATSRRSVLMACDVDVPGVPRR